MRILLISILSLFMLSCNSKEEIPHNVPQEVEISNEESIRINQFWVRDESFQINQYVERHGWDAITTESGIRYYIYENGDGKKVEKGMLVTLDFDIKLMSSDTSVLYSSENGAESFLVEMDNVESGLHEALKYLHVGDKAIVILPHFAAHGLLGDMNKIPPLSTVVYDIDVLYAKFPN